MTATRANVLTTTPVFVVSDLQASIDFYCGKLGFEHPSVWGEPPCFAMLGRGGFEIMLSLGEDPTHITPNGPNRVWDMYIRVDSVEREIEAVRAAGCEIAREPEKTFYQS